MFGLHLLSAGLPNLSSLQAKQGDGQARPLSQALKDCVGHTRSRQLLTRTQQLPTLGSTTRQSPMPRSAGCVPALPPPAGAKSELPVQNLRYGFCCLVARPAATTSIKPLCSPRSHPYDVCKGCDFEQVGRCPLAAIHHDGRHSLVLGKPGIDVWQLAASGSASGVGIRIRARACRQGRRGGSTHGDQGTACMAGREGHGTERMGGWRSSVCPGCRSARPCMKLTPADSHLRKDLPDATTVAAAARATANTAQKRR